MQFKTSWLALLPLALAGCGQNSASNSPASTSDASNTTPGASASASGAGAKLSGKPFVVGYNQWIGLTGVFMARDKGFFKDAGLDVQLKQFSGPADGVPPLISGQLDGTFTTADTPILLAKEASENTLHNVFIVDTSDGADGIAAQKGINSVSQLKGKTVAATKGQVNEFLLLKALQLNGMSDKDVTITNMDADASGAAIIAGKIPAAVTWEPWLSKAAGAGGKVIFSSRQTPDLILDVFTVSKQTLDSKPADVRAFIAACVKGADYALAHPAEAAAEAAKSFEIKPPDAKDMLTKVKIYGLKDNKRLMGSASAPGPAFKTANEISSFFVSQKVIAQAPDVKALFSSEYLPQ